MIELSSISVDVESVIVGEISSFKEESYLKAFFQTDETAYSKVKDSVQSLSWKFSKQDTATITAFINEEAIIVGKDIEVTDLKSALNIDKTVEGLFKLTTRPLSRGVVVVCFHSSEPESIHAVVSWITGNRQIMEPYLCIASSTFMEQRLRLIFSSET